MMNEFSPNQYPLAVLMRTGAEKQENWRKQIVRMMPPTLPMLMVILAMAVFMIQDYFLLEMLTVAMSSVAVTCWLSRMRSRFPQIAMLFNKQTRRIAWVVYWLMAGFFSISPAVATGTATTTGGGGACSATNTIPLFCYYRRNKNKRDLLNSRQRLWLNRVSHKQQLVLWMNIVKHIKTCSVMSGIMNTSSSYTWG
jgi:hypothetical protein